ncbi:MAG: hypothetical protein KF862_01370 [Chitinophagaceae bacterium]|nr:hypothetical protein [Chitinophagaceae bacterium]
MKKSVITYRALVTAIFIMLCIVFHQKPEPDAGLYMEPVQKCIQECKAESNKTFPEDGFLAKILLRFSEIIHAQGRGVYLWFRLV